MPHLVTISFTVIEASGFSFSIWRKVSLIARAVKSAISLSCKLMIILAGHITKENKMVQSSESFTFPLFFCTLEAGGFL